MRTHLKLKEVDDVLGGQKAWENVDKTTSELHLPQLHRGKIVDRHSNMSEMRSHTCLFPTTPNPVGWWANDYFLVCLLYCEVIAHTDSRSKCENCANEWREVSSAINDIEYQLMRPGINFMISSAFVNIRPFTILTINRYSLTSLTIMQTHIWFDTSW